MSELAPWQVDVLFFLVAALLLTVLVMLVTAVVLFVQEARKENGQ